jgi:7-carboxy-7-deazaguanine synthase
MATLTATADTLVVSECFATVQGEGPSLGRQASFIRLGGCNLHCAHCDTPYTWDATRFDLRTELHRRTTRSLLAQVALHGTPIAVITGGEPLLHQHQPAWERLLEGLADAGTEIEVETNGTVVPTPLTARLVTRFNASPKLSGALSDGADPVDARIRADALTALRDTGKASFKFVCGKITDIAEAAGLTAGMGIPPGMVWIMPEGTTADVITSRIRELADPAIACGFNVTPRLHVLCWGAERGR